MSDVPSSGDTTGADVTPFQAAVKRLLDKPENLSSSDLALVLGGLRGYLRRSTVLIDTDEIEDVAMTAILHLIEAARAGRVDTERNAAGYLLRTGRNLAVDVARGRRGQVLRHTQVPLDELPTSVHPTDDNVARMLDQHATAELVRQGLERAVSEGDATAFKVATFVLDALQDRGELPSSRQVADAIGISHTGVAKALSRFRRYLELARQPG